MRNPTVASWDCPTWLRRRWKGWRTAPEIIDLVAEYARRVMSGEIWWS
jgi:hypothetical protein